MVNKRISNPAFKIAAHNSNKHFLSPVLVELQHAHDGQVIWLDEKLYSCDGNGYDAELLFINSPGVVTGKLPLELLKDEHIFGDVYARLLSGAPH